MKTKSILIVDDNPSIVRLIVNELNKGNESWNIYRAGNGKEAVKVAKLELPDLILMDWEMPEMNGIEAIRKIRKNENTSEIPVIMATGEMITSENLQTALEAGAWDYVRKPIDFVELKARIYSTLKLCEQQQEIKRLLEIEIDLKNRKLSTASMLIVEKNAIIQQFYEDVTVVSDLLRGFGNTEQKAKDEISRIKKRIYHHLEADDSWETFKMHFEEVHPNFFKALSKLGTDISHKDLKLCAYLKLGMDTKEIARLLNVTAASIRTAMYRLKKKMNLTEQESLRDFLVNMG